MPVSAPVSVTQSTAPTRQTKPPVEGQAWQTALDSAHDVPSPHTPTTTPSTATDKIAAMSATSVRGGSTLQTVSARQHNETIAPPTQPDDELVVSSADPLTKPTAKKEDKKDQPPSSVNALAVAALQVPPQPKADTSFNAAKTNIATTTQSASIADVQGGVGLPATEQSRIQVADAENVSLPDPAGQNGSAKAGQTKKTSPDPAAALKPLQGLTVTVDSTATPAQAAQATQPAITQAGQATQPAITQAGQATQPAITQVGQATQPAITQASQATQPAITQATPGQSAKPAVNQAHIVQVANPVHTGQAAQPLVQPPSASAPTNQTVQPAIVAGATQAVGGKTHPTSSVATNQPATPGAAQMAAATIPGQITPTASGEAASGGAAPGASGTISAKLTTMSDKVAAPSVQPLSATSQPVAVSAVAMATANGAGSQPTGMDLKKSAETLQNSQAFGSVDGSSQASTVTAVVQTTQTSLSTGLNSINLSPSALSATITALHQSGQNGVTLRLDPPGLGHLSVQVKMNAQGAVNVLFVPSTTDAAHMLQNTLPQLGTALAQSGLTLGQAEVGGQFSQSGGQSGQQGGYTQARQVATPFAESASTSPSSISGLSAYA